MPSLDDIDKKMDLVLAELSEVRSLIENLYTQTKPTTYVSPGGYNPQNHGRNGELPGMG